jgi:hypothetical protein
MFKFFFKFKARQNLQICFMNETNDDQQEADAESSETKSCTGETPASFTIQPLTRFAFSSPTSADPISEIIAYQTQLQVFVLINLVYTENKKILITFFLLFRLKLRNLCNLYPNMSNTKLPKK